MMMVALSTALPNFSGYESLLKLRAPGQSHVLWRLKGGYFSCWLGQSFLKTNNEHRN